MWIYRNLGQIVRGVSSSVNTHNSPIAVSGNLVEESANAFRDIYDSKTNSVIAYVTDIEGHNDYWNNYINKSKILHRNRDAGSSSRWGDYGNLDFTVDNAELVYGGDVCDRGTADIRLLYDLLQLREKYPSRVHFILGNRDVNKLRLPFSLHEHVPYQGVYWTPPPGQTFPSTTAQFQWILQKTMGCPNTFEHRRAELQIFKAAAGSDDSVSDDEVVKSFLDLVEPDGGSDCSEVRGLLLRYLQAGKLALIKGDLLFVHGAVRDSNMGKVPPYNAASDTADGSKEWVQCSTAVEWVDALNAWAAAQVRDYVVRKDRYLDAMSAKSASCWDMEGGYNHPQPGSGLLQYGMGAKPDKSDTATIVYCSYLENGAPAPHSKAVADWLLQSGMRRVVVGHQPQGDAPLIQDVHGVQTISVDTSYAKEVQWPRKLTEELFTVPSSSTGGEKGDATEESQVAKAAADDEYHAFYRMSWLEASTKCTGNLEASDTRGRGVYVQALFFLPVVDGEGSGVVGPSTGLIYGQLTQTSPFGYWLPAVPMEGDSFIGKTTLNNWVVKARGVGRPTGVWEGDEGDCKALKDIIAEADVTALRPDKFFLLHWSQGFAFRQRLVRETDIQEEFQ